MIKKFLAGLLSISIVLSSAVIFAEEARAEEIVQTLDFTDVGKEHAAYEAVMDLVERGVINGKTKTKFFPEDSLKREELAKIVVKAFKLETKKGPVFTDVPSGVWYEEYARGVASSGLMTGISETKFGSGLNLTRQDLAVIIKRFLDNGSWTAVTDASLTFGDEGEISDYAKDAVKILCASNVMSTREGNLFKPKAFATRAETAIAIYKALSKEKEYMDSLGRMAPPSSYDPPYDVPMDDRLAEAMPTPFDANIWPKVEILYEDFEDEDYGELKKGVITGNVTFETEGGYNGGGCLKLTDESNAKFTLTLSLDDARPGDFFVFSCMIKAEGMSGSGNYRNTLQVYDDQGKWLAETGAGKRKEADLEWTEQQQILMIPEGVNVLTAASQSHEIRIGGYVTGLTGTVRFDDFKLYKIRFAPMDTVLMTPIYKGIIKGDDGVGDISLRAFIHESNGFYDLDNLKLTAQITDENHNVLLKSETEKVTPVVDVYFSSKTLPMGGNYYLETILSYKDTGEVEQKAEWRLHKREKDFETKYGFDDYGRITENGKPVFTLSVSNYTQYDDVVPMMIESGIGNNFKHSGMGWYYKWGTNETYRKLFTDLAEAGVNVTLSTGSMAFSNIYTGEVKERVKVQSDIRGLLSKIVNNFKDLPNLGFYYLWDEQNPVRYGEELGWARKIIEWYDLDHPVTGCADFTYDTRPGVFAKAADLIMYDPYPVTGKPDQDIALVYRRMKEGQRLNPGRPIGLAAQFFWYQKRGDLRGPTEEEFRNMCWQGICAGVPYIGTYSFGELRTRSSPGRTLEEEWGIWCKVYNEIEALEDIIVSVEPAPYYEVKGGGEWLNTIAKRHDGKSYLVTVNNEPTVKNANIKLDNVTKIKGMYSGKTFEANKDGVFELEWDGYEVEIFEFEQADYKSPHAELTRFALSDTILMDSDSEESTFIVPADMKEAEYKVYASDFAQIYLNGEKMEAATGVFDISGLNEITVKVVSEDGRFSNEKTYKIERS